MVGRGGTRFQCVADKLKTLRKKPKLMVVMTDLEFEWDWHQDDPGPKSFKKDLKGIDRPTQSQEERIVVVANSRYVDAAILQPEYDPSQQLQLIKRVDILAKGDDWDYIPGEETIQSLGGKLIKLGYTDNFW